MGNLPNPHVLYILMSTNPKNATKWETCSLKPSLDTLKMPPLQNWEPVLHIQIGTFCCTKKMVLMDPRGPHSVEDFWGGHSTIHYIIFHCITLHYNPPALRRRRVLGRWFSFFTMIICTASLRIEARTARLFESSDRPLPPPWHGISHAICIRFRYRSRTNRADAVAKADCPMTFEARLTASVCSEALIGAFRTWLLWASPVTCAQALWCLTTRNPSASVSHKQASLDTVPTSTERNPTQNCFSYRHNPYAIHCHFHALLPEKHITTKDTKPSLLSPKGRRNIPQV